MALNFRSLLIRTLTAAVFVAVLLSAICWNYYSFTTLFFVVSIWGLHEFFKIAELLGAKPFKWIGFVICALIYSSIAIPNIIFISSESSVMVFGSLYLSSQFLESVLILAFFLFMAALFTKNEKPIKNLAFTILGILYCGLPFYFLNKITFVGKSIILEHLHYSSHIVLGMILLIWASDTFAYLVGSLIGRTKLNERISPGKTWEGTIGGGVLTMASSYIVAGWFPEIQFVHWLVISLLVVVFGTLGDLFESLLKRQAGIKDSGIIMPGHGGILDRFDSLIFVAPFVYLYLSWVLS
jgi:phosphatidate cytidylyltransferase